MSNWSLRGMVFFSYFLKLSRRSLHLSFTASPEIAELSSLALVFPELDWLKTDFELLAVEGLATYSMITGCRCLTSAVD
jgi:hypothetical protein